MSSSARIVVKISFKVVVNSQGGSVRDGRCILDTHFGSIHRIALLSTNTLYALTIITSVRRVALASVTIHGIRTSAPVLAGIAGTVVDICLAGLACVPIQTDADKDTAFVLLARRILGAIVLSSQCTLVRIRRTPIVFAKPPSIAMGEKTFS